MFARCYSFAAVGLIAMLALPLEAQLNPKWQANNSPDFLDLFQQSNSASVKPEIVTVFDFSTSMNCIVYHRNYNAPAVDDFNDDESITFTLNSTTISGTKYYYPKASLGILDSSGKDGDRTSYTFVRPDGTVLVGNPTSPATAPNDATALGASQTAIRQTNNTITTPWGTVTLASAFNGPNNQEQDIRNWVRAASHVRFRVNNKNIDIPINWTILDETSTGYPLSPATGVDTSTSPATEYPLDSVYTIGTNGGFYANSSSSVSISLDATPEGRQAMRYRRAYLRWVFTGSNINPAETHAAFKNELPNMNRAQSVKRAAIRAWLGNQAKVLFAYRFLSQHDNGESNRSVINSNSRQNPWNSNKAYFCDIPWDTSCGLTTMGGVDRSWTVMNRNSSNGIRRLSTTCTANSTPLTLALANTLAQYNDTNHIFLDVAKDYNTVPEGDKAWKPEFDWRPKQCMRRFVILFTDGNPNNEPAASDASPYEYLGVGSAAKGNEHMASNKRDANPSKDSRYWSIPNLAAMAAHLNDVVAPPANYPSNTDIIKTVSDFLPFAVKNRGTVTFTGKYAAIQTMTVGVSLGGTYTSGSKGRLFKAAAMGDPDVKAWNINNLKPFSFKTPGDPTSGMDPNSVFFFDATDPASLEQGLDYAFRAATAKATLNTTSAPVLPTLGTGLGAAVYLAKFEPPKTGGPIWSGDLLMYPIREDSKGISQLLNNAGEPLSSADLADAGNAQWAASKVLAAKGWSNRVIFTRTRATAGSPHPPMQRVVVKTTDTADSITDSGYRAIEPLLAPEVPNPPGPTTAQKAAKFDNWRYFIGADVGSAEVVKPTRTTIMGDIVNSTPAVLDFSTMPTTVTNQALAKAWKDHEADNPRFRVIFVGTNQGFLHAFGEVSWAKTAGSHQIQTGVMDELWAFAPTDLLPHISYFRDSGNAHRSSVDGSPTVYLLDLPPLSGVRGNGVFDVGSAKERALVIFGLGKGGRSYYAIDVRDPVSPVFQESNANYGLGMGWSLCPDEPDNYPTSRFTAPASSDTRTAIIKMGLSTSVPTLGRVVATSSKLVKDVVFLGGGFSVPEIENRLPAAPATPPNSGATLGRSVIAVEAKGGNFLKVWDMSSTAGVGPVSTGVAPHTFFRGSGLHQRAYFSDHFGGVWALGYNTKDDLKLRMDSSYLDQWEDSPRPVYKQGPTDGLSSSMPIPFSIPPMPIRTADPLVSPSAVGLAFVSGDRNNPLDRAYAPPSWPIPTQHRLSVVFDRQDSYLLGLDTDGMSSSNLANAGLLSADEKNPFHELFYLKSKYGYYVNFPTRPANGQFAAKGMFSPLLLGGRVFYSYFDPTESDPCVGGKGETRTYRIMNVMLPDPKETEAASANESGKIMTWSGVASPFAVRNLVTGLQAGVSGSSVPGSPGSMQIKALETGSTDIYPKPRIWRTVH